MSYLRTIRTISISTALLVHSTGSFATNIDQDFQRCVSEALQQQGKSATAISVNTGGLKQQELDHSVSFRTVQYRAQVNTKTSGKDLGTVTCRLSRSGDLLSASFDS